MDVKSFSKEDISKLRITHKSKITPLQPIITIANSLFAIKGGLSMVTGKTGSGKSSVLRVILSLTLMDSDPPKWFDNLGIVATPAKGKPVIYLNTEMPDSSLFKKIHNEVLKDIQATSTPDNFIIIQALGCSPEERKTWISHLLETYPDTHLLIIDGGADTVTSVNDEPKSIEAIEELNQLANEYQTTIVNVVHENKGNGLTRGHYGQQGERKATGIISIKFEKRLFIISCVKSRETAPFEDIRFMFDEKGNICQADPATIQQRQEEAKENQVLALVLDGFKLKPRWKVSEYKKWIAEKIKMDVKTGGRRVDEMFTANYITTDGPGYIKSLLPVEDPAQLEIV